MENLQNAIELKVILGVNDAASKGNLNSQISELQKKLDQVKIDIKIDPKAISALEKLSTMDFSKLTQQIGNVGKETAKMATVSAEEYEKAMKVAAEKTRINFGSAIRGSAEDIEFIENKLKGMNATIDVKFDTKNGEKHLKSLQTSVEKNGITQKVKFEQVMVGNGDESTQLWMPKIIQDTNKTMANTSKNTEELIAKIKKLHTEGKITTDQFNKFSTTLGNIDDKTAFNRINQQINEMVATTKKVNANLTERDQIEKRLVANQQKIQTQILSAEKAMKSNPKLGGTQEAKDLLESYQKLNPASETFKDNLFEVNTQFTRMKTAASEASRENMGMISMFKTAMEKFPIDFQVGIKLFELLETP